MMRISEERWPEYPQPMEVSSGERKKLLIEEPCTHDITEGDRENTKGQNDKLRGIRTIALKDDGTLSRQRVCCRTHRCRDDETVTISMPVTT